MKEDEIKKTPSEDGATVEAAICGGQLDMSAVGQPDISAFKGKVR